MRVVDEDEDLGEDFKEVFAGNKSQVNDMIEKLAAKLDSRDMAVSVERSPS